MKHNFDFLVIGSGIAGLSYALKVADHGKVCVLAKSELGETNTKYAQGGIASVMYDPDNFEKHIKDTLICGDGMCKEEVVRMVVSEAPNRIQDLINWGVNFDKKDDKNYDLAREGGHSEKRILHYKDATGIEIQRALTEKAKQHSNITLLENYSAIDLLTQHQLGRIIKRYHDDIECYGAYVIGNGKKEVETVLSKVTVVATGGSGNIYLNTTNPRIATGDGIAMVYRAKGIIENMQFMQFHPTSLYNPNEKPAFLITEAMRGYGGVLRTPDGKEFMRKYDERDCLAPRDIVARSIDNEMKINGLDFVYLDVTHKDAEETKSHFPFITKKCLSLGIDITKDMIPVVPAAHYSCGGVKVNINGQASVNRLYAIGEVSSTGLHGANRLASNSLIEAVVFADRAAKHSLKVFSNYSFMEEIPEWDHKGTSHPEEMVLITQNFKEMQQIMSNYVGIVRSDLRLERALRRLEIIYTETENLFKESILSLKLCELRNLINVGYLVIKMAQEFRESRGLHFTTDHPKKGGNGSR